MSRSKNSISDLLYQHGILSTPLDATNYEEIEKQFKSQIDQCTEQLQKSENRISLWQLLLNLLFSCAEAITGKKFRDDKQEELPVTKCPEGFIASSAGDTSVTLSTDDIQTILSDRDGKVNFKGMQLYSKNCIGAILPNGKFLRLDPNKFPYEVEDGTKLVFNAISKKVQVEDENGLPKYDEKGNPEYEIKKYFYSSLKKEIKTLKALAKTEAKISSPAPAQQQKEEPMQQQGEAPDQAPSPTRPAASEPAPGTAQAAAKDWNSQFSSSRERQDRNDAAWKAAIAKHRGEYEEKKAGRKADIAPTPSEQVFGSAGQSSVENAETSSAPVFGS